jgi:hypothetical protein
VENHSISCFCELTGISEPNYNVSKLHLRTFGQAKSDHTLQISLLDILEDMEKSLDHAKETKLFKNLLAELTDMEDF